MSQINTDSVSLGKTGVTSFGFENIIFGFYIYLCSPLVIPFFTLLVGLHFGQLII